MLFISIQANDAQLRGPLALLIVTVKAPHLDFTKRSDSICQVDTLIVNLIVLRDYALSERTVFCTCAATLPNFLLVDSVLLLVNTVDSLRCGVGYIDLESGLADGHLVLVN